MFGRFCAAVAALVLTAGSAAADPAQLTPEQQAELQKLTILRDSLKPVHGAVQLPGAKAALQLGSGYYFLNADDAKKVITQGWGNPPDAADGVLGIVFPEGKSFIDSSWGAVVTYNPTLYVSDKDAKTADYNKLLSDMQAGEADDNAQRQKTGFAARHLVGWAQPPQYEASRHDLIWARELQFGDEAEHTLNYDVRHLGRYGVLSLNMVATMSDLPNVKPAAETLARIAEFEPGARYADYKDGDKTAGYGLAGLVAAGAGLLVAKKLGLLAVLLVFAKKGIVLILAAVGGGWAWIRRRFSKPAPALPAVEPVEEQVAEPADT
ncbi:MAG: rane-anchored protein-like protein [Phenylobacterium sp.]|jgi:uncharacterized membrane-anchored protein|nr:rane-anchored protein-like protein [Phenylobacterium sp.]MDB5463590.1 rane-anchored protein-like protein [Phenylobacterium sp.]